MFQCVTFYHSCTIINVRYQMPLMNIELFFARGNPFRLIVCRNRKFHKYRILNVWQVLHWTDFICDSIMTELPFSLCTACRKWHTTRCGKLCVEWYFVCADLFFLSFKIENYVNKRRNNRELKRIAMIQTQLSNCLACANPKPLRVCFETRNSLSAIC